VSNRKKKKQEMVAKKRQIMPGNDQSNATFHGVDVAELVDNIRHCGDANIRLESVIQIRKLLSSEKSPPIEEILRTGALPLFISFLDLNDDPQLQFESAWVLTNIASGTSEQTDFVVQSGAVPAFVRLMCSPKDELREQAAWALGNIAGDSPEKRNIVLQAGALEPLLHCITHTEQIGVIRNCGWTLSNFCRGKPPPPFPAIAPALPILSMLLNRSQDEEILTDVCWALSYLTDGTNDRIQPVIEQEGIVPRVVELLDHENPTVQTPALRVIGNIVTGDEAQTEAVLRCPTALIMLKKLLQHPNKAVRKEACWGISNITAGSPVQIDAVIKGGIIPVILSLMESSSEFEIKKEAAWALSNASTCGNEEQLLFLTNLDVIHYFCSLIDCQDPATISVCLDGLENILKLGNDTSRFGVPNPFTLQIEECEGLDKLHDLSNHQIPHIFHKVGSILDYFDDDDYLDPDEEDGAYGFGTGGVQKYEGEGFQF
jgi:HEAT repeat protein